MTQDLSGLPPELLLERERYKRQQSIADALIEQAMQPLPTNQMAGGYVVPLSPFQGFAQLANSYVGGRQRERAEEGMAGIGKRYNEGLADAVKKYSSAKMGAPATSETIVDEQAAGGEGAQATINAPAVAGDPRKAITEALASPYAPMQRIAQMDLGHLNRAEDRKDQQAFLRSQAEIAAANRSADIAMRLAEGRISKEEADARMAALRKEMQEAGFAQQRSMAQLAAGLRPQQTPVAIVGPDGKPVLVSPDQAIGQRPYDKKAGAGLPPAALKLQQEEIDAIGISSSINADLGAMESQITSGKLNPSLIGNALNKARNAVGLSTEESRNLASFQATLEKLRNDSLRLNKGVQTEGDAVRAWNEMIANITDKDLVKQRLAEIRKINERAVNLRKMNIEAIRTNFGLDPLNTEGFENQPPAVGSGASPAPAGRTNVADPLRIRTPK